MGKMEQEKELFAFISYSRRDKKVANWMHTQLENYEYPHNLVNEEQRPHHPKYLRPIFLDTKDMQVEVRPFTERIKNALERSRFLILLCSSNSAKSTFVDQEVKYFLEKHDNNYSLIVPLFIDDVLDDTIPPCIMGTTIMNRHFPIYNSKLEERSEANMYCLYQITAYMLGCNFSDIYNRYEVLSKRKQKAAKRRLGAVITALLLVAAALGWAWYESQRVIDKGQELLNLERNVFPAAVVFGYEENFLRPVINSLKYEDEDFRIFIMMPNSNRDLRHFDRINDINYTLKKALGIDSLSMIHLKTNTRNGSRRIHRMVKDGQFVPVVYLDFATTTTSFYQIANHKIEGLEKNNLLTEEDKSRDDLIDELIKEYTVSFIAQTNKRLGSDSTHVVFASTKEELVSKLRTFMNP